MDAAERYAILEKKFEEILLLLTPHDVSGHEKLRMGAYGDGGYVMLDPGYGGVAYSFGISGYSPWDEAMAKRGFKIYQYDGTIPESPYAHPLIFFHPYNIGSGPETLPTEKNITQIIHENNHEQESNIILQIDIEGAEWKFFEYIDTSDIRKFDQIIAEFHWILDIEKIDYYINILKKICETHQVIHFHYNNYGGGLLFKNFLAGQVLEVSFVKKETYSFTVCNDTFPTKWDAPNKPDSIDMIIGNFSRIEEENFENFVSDKQQFLYFSLNNSIHQIQEDIKQHFYNQLHALSATISQQNEKIDKFMEEKKIAEEKSKEVFMEEKELLYKKLEEADRTINQLAANIDELHRMNMRMFHPFKRLWGHITGKKYPQIL